MSDHSAMHDARVFRSLGDPENGYSVNDNCESTMHKSQLGRLLNVLEPENTLPNSNTNPDQRADEGNRFR